MHWLRPYQQSSTGVQRTTDQDQESSNVVGFPSNGLYPHVNKAGTEFMDTVMNAAVKATEAGVPMVVLMGSLYACLAEVTSGVIYAEDEDDED